MTSTKIPLAELDLDVHFVEQCQRLGLLTLSDIMNAKVAILSKKKDFSFTWYADMLDLLKNKGLLGEFQERQL